MVNKNLEVKDELSETKVSGKLRLLRKFAWAMIAGVASVMTLAAYLEGFAGPAESERQRPEVAQYADNFSIGKAEGRDSDEVHITYLKSDCVLSGVNCVVAFHYESGATPNVVEFWPNWQSGETKTFTNVGFRNGRIQRVDFWGTARENSFKGGPKTVTRVTFSERKTF
jgi:hypothetical protein